MEIEFNPCLRNKRLHAPVEHGRPRYAQALQRGVEAVDIVEMNNAHLAPADDANQNHHQRQAEYGHADQQARIAEIVDEGGYRVVRDGAFQQHLFVNPALCGLVAGHLDPDGVGLVRRNLDDVGHHNLVAPIKRTAVVQPELADGARLVFGQHQ